MMDAASSSEMLVSINLGTRITYQGLVTLKYDIKREP
jgi:hypothetical protein